jgi:para-nitrobenzyl esterase
MRLARVLLVLVVLTGCGEQKPWAIARPDVATKRTTESGDVVGGEGRYGSHAWLGIPFAAPPVGDFRWRSPRRPAAWTGVREALSFSPACAQFASALGVPGRSGDFAGQEDCLYLNVWAPQFAPDAVPRGGDRLPVMFWIHGGGNSIGSASSYDGGHLATAERVIVVTTQYRLGPFGWLRHRSLRATGGDDLERSGNFAILDLIRGLQWVRDNIAAFGGDPSNVTVFGESAGAMDTVALLFAPEARGLFHRAISESGGLRSVSAEEAENFTDDTPAGHKSSSNEAILRMLLGDKLAPDRAAAKTKLAGMTDGDVEKYLRGKNTGEILDAYHATRLAGMIDMPLVFRDGVALSKGEWLDRLATPDGWNRVPVIFGTNRDEMRLFFFIDPRFTWKLFGLFPRFRDETRYLAATEHLSRAWKLTGADAPAAAIRRSGWTDVYVYRFDWDQEPTSFGTDLSKMLGAAHGVEIPFVFGHFDLGPLSKYLFAEKTTDSRTKLSAAMMSYWSQFAATGAPGQGRSPLRDVAAAGTLPQWTAWDSEPQAPKFEVFAPEAPDAHYPPGRGIHMSEDAITKKGLIDEVDDDSRLPSQLEKCLIFHEYVQFGQAITKEEYVHAGKNGCVAFPFDGFPWGAKL